MKSHLEELLRRSPLAPAARRLRRLFHRPTSKERNKLYDIQTVEVLRRVLSPDSTAVDVGANRGSILNAIVEIAPHGLHYAFEPIPELAIDLRKRFPGVHVFECALTDQVGSASFQFIKNAPGYSGLRPRIEYDFPHRLQIEPITVHTDTLDNVLPNDAAVAFIKIDVEGAEYHVMKGAVSTIRRCRPVIVFEASDISTGAYGISPSTMYHLITVELGMRLSTMYRWLHGSKPYSARQFASNWKYGPEFYYVAYPSHWR